MLVTCDKEVLLKQHRMQAAIWVLPTASTDR